MRDRVMTILAQIGYKPEIQTAFVCGDFDTCGTVNNVVARLDGADQECVLLSAHYDSVAAGPGASDDGSGVAALLEIARLLKVRPEQRHSVIFLIDDGEEPGLLGAKAFIEHSPWAKDVRGAVNMDARGTDGPSLMFETGTANDWLMGIYSRAVRFPNGRPITNSIYYTAYQYLPNRTDFTFFKAAGYQGFNFAFISGAARYHTPVDNFQNADPASIQHQGENALATLVALSNSDLDHAPPGAAVFFDIFALTTLHWPASLSLPVGAIVFALILAEIVLLMRVPRDSGPPVAVSGNEPAVEGDAAAKRPFPPGARVLALPLVRAALSTTLGAVAVAGFLGIALQMLLRSANVFPSEWIAYPLPSQIAFSSVAFVGVFFSARRFTRITGFWPLWAGLWFWWGLLGVLLAIRFPAMSFLFVVPTAIAAFAAIPAIQISGETPEWAQWLAVLAPGVAAIILWFSTLWNLYDALGSDAFAGISTILAVALTCFLPVFGDDLLTHLEEKNALLGGATGITLLAAIAAVLAPAYTPDVPQRSNIEYVLDSDSGKAEWQVFPDSRELPSEFRQGFSFSESAAQTFPWEYLPGFTADAPHLDLPAPTLSMESVTEQGRKRTYRGILKSARGALDVTIYFPPSSGISDFSANGIVLPPPEQALIQFLNNWRAYDFPSMTTGGVEIQFTLPNASPVQIYLQDESYDLPPEGIALQKARPPDAVASQDGDITIVSRRIQIKPETVSDTSKQLAQSRF